MHCFEKMHKNIFIIAKTNTTHRDKVYKGIENYLNYHQNNLVAIGAVGELG